MPGTEAVALIVFWGILAAEEFWAWQVIPQLTSGATAGSSGATAGLPSSAQTTVAQPNLDARTPDFDERPGPGVVQQLTRSRTPDGSETISGWLRIPLLAGQRTATVHLAFCPPFQCVPELETEQQDGPDATIRVGQVLPYGARLEFKLADVAEAPAEVLVEYSAVAACATGREEEGDKPIAIAIAVVERAGRFLIGHRREGVPLAGLWEFPGGKVRSGETPEEAAARECLEETGLAVRIGRLLATVQHEYEHGRVLLHFFAAVPQSPQTQPRGPFRWVARAELTRYEFPAANAAVIEKLMAARD
jgi:mutator protein MutT